MKNDDGFKLLRGFADRQTNERTDERTLVIVESLSRLKKSRDIPKPFLKPGKVPFCDQSSGSSTLKSSQMFESCTKEILILLKVKLSITT